MEFPYKVAMEDFLETGIRAQGNSRVKVTIADDGETARARSYVTVYQALPDFPLQAIFIGGYIDDFVNVDGAWRFSQRQAVPYFVGDLSRHAREFLASTAE